MQPKCGRCGTALEVGTSRATPVVVTDDSFEQVLRGAGEKPVLIDCWAEWCPPCKMLSPTIDALAAESGERWVIGKLDVNSNPATASRFRVEGIPTMLLFKNGQLVEKLVGLQPKQAIEQRLASHVVR